MFEEPDDIEIALGGQVAMPGRERLVARAALGIRHAHKEDPVAWKFPQARQVATVRKRVEAVHEKTQMGMRNALHDRPCLLVGPHPPS